MAAQEVHLVKIIRGVRYQYDRRRDTISSADPTPARESAARVDFERTIRDGSPVDLCIEVTTRCNIECANCFSDSTPRRRGVELDAVAARRHLEQHSPELIRVCLTGGEPMLHSRIRELLRLPALFQGLGFVLSTNATVRRELDSEIADNRWLTAVSLHGDQDAHNAYSRSSSFGLVTRRIEALAKRTTVHLYAVIHDGMRTTDIEWLIRFRRDAGCAILRFVAPRPHGRFVELRRPELMSEIRTRLDDTVVLKTAASTTTFLSAEGTAGRTH